MHVDGNKTGGEPDPAGCPLDNMKRGMPHGEKSNPIIGLTNFVPLTTVFLPDDSLPLARVNIFRNYNFFMGESFCRIIFFSCGKNLWRTIFFRVEHFWGLFF